MKKVLVVSGVVGGCFLAWKLYSRSVLNSPAPVVDNGDGTMSGDEFGYFSNAEQKKVNSKASSLLDFLTGKSERNKVQKKANTMLDFLVG